MVLKVYKVLLFLKKKGTSDVSLSRQMIPKLG